MTTATQNLTKQENRAAQGLPAELPPGLEPDEVVSGGLRQRQAKRNVVQLLRRVATGRKSDSSLFRLAQSIEREWGGMEPMAAAYVDSVKAVLAKNRGTAQAANLMKDLVKLQAGIYGQMEAQPDWDVIGDDEKEFNRARAGQLVIDILAADNAMVREVIEEIPGFDKNVVIELVKSWGLFVGGPDEMVEELSARGYVIVRPEPSLTVEADAAKTNA